MARASLLIPLLVLLLSAAAPAVAADAAYPQVRPGVTLAFPRDHGSHPEFRTEWWYLTGWIRTADGADLGVQVTFFRNRPGLAEDNPSQFAPRELLFAHAALADPAAGRLLHDERSARAGFGIAQARVGEAAVRLEDWTLARDGEAWVADIKAKEFRLALRFTPTQPVLVQGEGGYSRKGPKPAQASYYYSLPQLAVSGEIARRGAVSKVSGRAWMDHEWSSEVMAPEAVGWDWAGINLDDGGSLMAFRMRNARGEAIWAGGSLRTADGRLKSLGPKDVRFEPLRTWRSPRSGASWPVAMRIHAAGRQWELAPLMDDQELDARASTNTVYWEGAVRASESGKPAGRGYLELTGYWKPLKL